MDPDSKGSSVDLTKVHVGLAAARAISERLLNAQEEIDVDRVRIFGQVARVGDITVADLLALTPNGHTFEVTAQAGDWTLIVRSQSPQNPSVDMSGSPDQALPGKAIDPMRQAVVRQDAQEALALAEDVAGAISITVRNDPTAARAHWIENVEALNVRLAGPRWAATAGAVTAETAVVVIDDLKGMCVTTRAATFAGPDASIEVPKQDDVDGGYRQTRIAEGWLGLPSPFAFHVRTSTGASSDQEKTLLRRLEESLHGTAERLVWYWLASKAQVEANGVLTLTFSGAREVFLTIAPHTADSAESEVELYEWASSGTDPARRESLQQAVSLALVTPADLVTAARPALRTAKLLYELAQRGAVAEALAARRTARDATAASARGAAEAARAAAGKAIERALLQAAAAAGIVLSNAGNLIGRGPAAVLLGLVGMVALGSMIVTVAVELPSASRGLDSELKDLSRYRDMLSEEEIADATNAEAVKSARVDLGRARNTVVAVYVSVIVTAVALGIPFVWARHRQPGGSTPTGSLTPVNSSPPVLICGTWRWGVKTLSDRQANEVNFMPKQTTVRDLRSEQRPQEAQPR